MLRDVFPRLELKPLAPSVVTQSKPLAVPTEPPPTTPAVGKTQIKPTRVAGLDRETMCRTPPCAKCLAFIESLSLYTLLVVFLKVVF